MSHPATATIDLQMSDLHLNQPETVPSDKFGLLLGRLIPLSEHDVEEILQEQRSSNRRFGDVALSLGLCQPEHIWRVWMSQLDSHTPRVRLEKVGVDATAAKYLTGEQARDLRAIPVRCVDEQLLVAVSHTPDSAGLERLEKATGRKVKLVIAAESELSQWIERYYPKKSL